MSCKLIYNAVSFILLLFLLRNSDSFLHPSVVKLLFGSLHSSKFTKHYKHVQSKTSYALTDEENKVALSVSASHKIFVLQLYRVTTAEVKVWDELYLSNITQARAELIFSITPLLPQTYCFHTTAIYK